MTQAPTPITFKLSKRVIRQWHRIQDTKNSCDIVVKDLHTEAPVEDTLNHQTDT